MVVTGRKRSQEAQYKMREITGWAAILRTSCSFSFGDIDLAVNVKVMRSGRAGQQTWMPGAHRQGSCLIPVRLGVHG